MAQKNKEEDKEIQYFKKIGIRFIWGLIGILIIAPYFPNFFPCDPIKSFWFTKGEITDWINSGFYLIIWGVLVHIFILLKKINSYPENSPIDLFFTGFKRSIFAGIWEEIAFRWIIFLGCMIGLFISNWILGGFYYPNGGIIKWMNSYIFVPIANYCTFGILNHQLTGYVWYFGASIIVTNGLFRDGHKYQGFFGFINSWFCGMFLFYIMFKHGITAAIFLHFLYNFICYTIISISELIRTIIHGKKPVNQNELNKWLTKQLENKFKNLK